ncbi:MAG: 3-phosphoshikimate 1-carboxyvinyltransferase [Gemmatimonadota bacterium]
MPGDKSISHRALLLGALGGGESRFTNVNAGGDVAATAAALAACGLACEVSGTEAVVRGGPLRAPAADLDLGNSGTGVRLLAGLLAGSGVPARLTGDASLRSRPMDRIVEPLRRMGADVRAEGGGGRLLPLEIRRSRLRELEHDLPVASAQVKSCLLLAGAAAGVAVVLREPAATRDHTERMLLAMGAGLRVSGLEVALGPGTRLRPLDMRIPGDLSSAAFLLGLAALVPGVELELAGVGVNPGRTGVLDLLSRMGADLSVIEREPVGGEPVADLRIRHAGRLRAVDVGADLAPRLLDEVPLLAALAATAEGVTRIRGVGELRVKESDRLRGLVEGLAALGVRARELEDGLEVEGTDGALRGAVDTRGDHRLAMAFAVLGRRPGARVVLSETDSVATSFPEFPALLLRLAP